MDRDPPKKARGGRTEALQLDFSVDALQGEPAEPLLAAIQAISRAIEQIRIGVATVHIKGQTEHHCQVQLVPLFMARAAGLEVQDAGLGRLRIGKSDVVFEPLLGPDRGDDAERSQGAMK
jgi:hypothetical protein